LPPIVTDRQERVNRLATISEMSKYAFISQLTARPVGIHIATPEKLAMSHRTYGRKSANMFFYLFLSSEMEFVAFCCILTTAQKAT
jgi:hypothetical protein